MARCQLDFASSQPAASKAKLITGAKRTLTQTKALYPSLGGDKWTVLFEELLAKAKTAR